MTDHPERKRRSVRQIIRDGLYNAVFRPGLPRWVLLAVAVLVFMFSALYLTGSIDFRENASALVPRSADLFIETRDPKALLENADAWRIWLPARGAGGGAVHSTELEKAIAGLVSQRVSGLPITAPLRWLEDADGAAFCVSSGDGTASPSWSLYLRLKDVSVVLGDIEVEPKMKLEPVRGDRDNGIFTLTGSESGRLSVGVVTPWLILSGDEKLIEFALEAKRRPSQSLAGTDMLPGWRRGDNLRGIVSPAYATGVMRWPEAGLVSAWIAPDSRIVLAGAPGRNGGIEMTLSTAILSEHPGAGGFWPLFFVVAVILAILSLALFLVLVLAMVGWGGWLKLAAKKAGITPASEPATVVPSDAFQRDVGLAGGRPAETPPEPVKEGEDARTESESAPPRE